MEHVIIRGVATVGQPDSVGHFGTITIDAPLADGKIPYTFVLDHREHRRLRAKRSQRLDISRQKGQDTG